MAKLGKNLFCGLFLFLAAWAAQAQQLSNLHGSVKDPSGAVVSGATVTVRSLTSTIVTKVRTDVSGNFAFGHIEPGQYTLQVDVAGFQPISQIVQVRSDDTPNVELTLGALSPVSSSVEVRASRDEVQQTLSPGVVSVVYPDDTKGEFKSLPDLLDQIPGVYTRRVGSNGQYTTASVRGSAPSQVNIYVDGVPFNLASEAAADLSTLPIANVERVEVYRGVVPARFSGAPIGGAINIVTKTPTDFHLTGSAGARTLGGRQFSLALNGPVLRGKFLFGADEERSLGDFTYTNYLTQSYQKATSPVDSPYGGKSLCTIETEQQGYVYNPLDACNISTQRKRLNNSFSKDNLLAKWQNEHFSAKWSYLYMNRLLPYGVGTDDLGDLPAAGPSETARHNQVLKQTEGVLGWNQNVGKLNVNLIANVMDQDKKFTNEDAVPPWEYALGGAYSKYHTRRWGTEGDITYALGEGGPLAQRFDLYGDWLQEVFHADASYLLNANANLQNAFLSLYERHKTDFQIQDTLTVRALHNLEITPMGRVERLTGPTIGSIRSPFATGTGNYGWRPTGSIALKDRIGRGWQVYASYGKYIRYPNFYEIYGDGIYIIPHINTDGTSVPLQAEIGRTADFGAGWDGATTPKLSEHIRLTFFRRATANNITLLQAQSVGYYMNTGDVINRGIEFEGSLHYGSVASLQAAFTVQDGGYNDKGFYFYGDTTPVYATPGKTIPALNSPYSNGDVRLDLHFFRNALTTFIEAKYVGENVIGINPTNYLLSNSGIQSRYDGSVTYERPLTTIDAGVHWKLPHGGTFSGGVTDLFNQGPKQLLGGNFDGGKYTWIWYTCSTNGTTYTNPPATPVCPPYGVTTYTASTPLKVNVFFPQQGRTLYMLLAWDVDRWWRRPKQR